MESGHAQIGEVAARTELSLRTIRHYEEIGLVTPSARSHGGFRLYTEGDVVRLLLIRRMKPLGFTLEEMRDLLDITARLDSPDAVTAAERDALTQRLRQYHEKALDRVRDLHIQVQRAEEFATALGKRL